jgi:hypothetical protein
MSVTYFRVKIQKRRRKQRKSTEPVKDLQIETVVLPAERVATLVVRRYFCQVFVMGAGRCN